MLRTDSVGARSFLRRSFVWPRDALQEAWKLDPANAEAANGMLIVAKGHGAPRATMEEWYQRAIQADPDSLRAAGRRIEYLYPVWHGSEEEMTEFGRELLAGGRWEAGLPLKLVEMHWWRASYHDSGRKPVDPAYFAANAAEAWKDVKAVYEPYLKRVPDSRYHRTRYALIAAWCGEWVEAKRQFAVLGDDFSHRVAPEALYRQARDQVIANAGKEPRTAEDKQPAGKSSGPAAQPLPF